MFGGLGLYITGESNPLFFSGFWLLFFIAAFLLGFIFFWWVFLASMVKRLHDLNKSAWVLVFAFAVFLVLTLGSVTLVNSERMIFDQIIAALGGGFIIGLGCYRGTEGKNLYGADWKSG
jgi:uncharacterized membrane protein YhaH (DUF805 family)